VPGNHDIDDAGRRSQGVTEERLRCWRTHFGPDRLVEDVEERRFIGLDALLFSSGERGKRMQADWPQTVMNEAKGRRIAWFLHRPLFLESPHEGDTGYLSVEPQPRAHLLDLVNCYSVPLVASGHLHKAHDFRHDGTHYIWSPRRHLVSDLR
jgi:hypothetical protein